MLEKVAVWYLRKKNVSVLLNCGFDKRVSIKMKNKVYHKDNHYISGTEFLFDDGNRFVLEAKELET